MTIFVVDDSCESRVLSSGLLVKNGYEGVREFDSAQSLFSHIHQYTEESVDLILLDILMPNLDGIATCARLKQMTRFKDVPVIMLTAINDHDKLDEAFSAGASDYVVKPVHHIELLARVRSALRVKGEIEQRKRKEQELEEVTNKLKEVNQYLEQISMLDGLTGIANRRSFDELYAAEWKRSLRFENHISLIFADIDFFKAYNDEYGHLAGDECLKMVSIALKQSIRRGSDFVARFGGEEFVVLLPGTDLEGAIQIAEAALKAVEELNIPHRGSTVNDVVTISLGVASQIPGSVEEAMVLVEMADKELYRAKEEGRNRVVAATISGHTVIDSSVAS